MIYLTDVVGTLMTGKRIDEIMLAFLPMKTTAFNSMQTNATYQLTLAFPFFLMLVYLLPLYYMVTRLAEEKEMKTREAMKMMGLRDFSYYTAWAVFLSVMVALMSALLVCTLSMQTLRRSGAGLVFAMCFLYGMNLYGVSFAITAWLPSKKSSATAASLIHLLSYYTAFKYSGYTTSASTKQIAAFVPNCAMAFCV
jgi:mannose/fructose/N-acetylgalactosamine-specific phosphotransferase system component IIC